MKLIEYPKITIIIRGLKKEYVLYISEIISRKFSNLFALEVTLNTPNAYEIIHEVSTKYGKDIYVGAGTVQTKAEAERAIESGAKFLLGPKKFPQEIFELCQQKGIVSVPAAMTATEVSDMFALGADIVKVFPAEVVKPRFFKDIQAPFGPLKLMAVGGVNEENMRAYFENGATYIGIGSSLFELDDITNFNEAKIIEKLQNIYAKTSK